MSEIETIIFAIGFVIVVVGITRILRKVIFILLDRLIKRTEEKEVK